MEPLSPYQPTLARQQVLAPLSLSLFIISALITGLVVSPTLVEVNDQYLTVLTPKNILIGLYWLVLAALLVGNAILLAVAPTLSLPSLVNGVGLRLGVVNLLMAAWCACFVARWFLAAQIILLIVAVGVVSIWLTLLKYPAVISRPFDYLFTQVPITMFLVILLQVDIWQGGLLALHYFRTPGGPHGGWESQHSMHSWILFGIVLGIAFINAAVVFVYTDAVWATASIYLYVALAIQSEGKPPQVFIACILAGALVLVALLSSIGWKLIKKDREGQIRLAEEAEAEARV